MQEDNPMFDKILKDLERIINDNTEFPLKSFSIVPVIENKNKSPILLEQHNGTHYHLGLESWCVKHIYKYAYVELFKVRRLLKKNKLTVFKMESVNKYLIGALLINPEVTTFWNMKRELVEQEILQIDRELAFTNLILSYKCKSSETFTYRKWLLKRLLCNMDLENQLQILPLELSVTETAAEKAENNYHSWTHRIWCLENVFSDKLENVTLNQRLNNIIASELNFSADWIDKHVSQHSGYHYRHFLINCVKKNFPYRSSIYSSYYSFVKCLFQISPFDFSKEVHFVNRLLGECENFFDRGDYSISRYQNCSTYICILLYELFYTLKQLFCFYAKHESVWYHRRFVIYHLLKWMYDYYGIDCRAHIKVGDKHQNSANIVDVYVNENENNDLKFTENGEKFAKMLKYEADKLESSVLYRTIVQLESETIRRSISGDCEHVQRLAQRYERWLKHIVCLKGL